MAGRISYLGGIVKNGLVLDLDAGKADSYPRTGTLWNDLSGYGMVIMGVVLCLTELMIMLLYLIVLYGIF
jgi:hypothetical protein